VKQKSSEWEDMRDRKDFPGSWLGAVAALTAAGVGASRAQMPLPTVKPTGADLFNQQCATCHSLNPADPPRQGPLLAGVYGGKPGSVASFRYSPGYDKADFTWDETHLDLYLTDPQAVIPGSMMLYKQKNVDTRKAIISFLKGQK
jgi:cytochrome c